MSSPTRKGSTTEVSSMMAEAQGYVRSFGSGSRMRSESQSMPEGEALEEITDQEIISFSQYTLTAQRAVLLGMTYIFSADDDARISYSRAVLRLTRSIYLSCTTRRQIDPVLEGPRQSTYATDSGWGEAYRAVQTFFANAHILQFYHTPITGKLRIHGSQEDNGGAEDATDLDSEGKTAEQNGESPVRKKQRPEEDDALTPYLTHPPGQSMDIWEAPTHLRDEQAAVVETMVGDTSKAALGIHRLCQDGHSGMRIGITEALERAIQCLRLSAARLGTAIPHVTKDGILYMDQLNKTLAISGGKGVLLVVPMPSSSDYKRKDKANMLGRAFTFPYCCGAIVGWGSMYSMNYGYAFSIVDDNALVVLSTDACINQVDTGNINAYFAEKPNVVKFGDVHEVAYIGFLIQSEEALDTFFTFLGSIKPPLLSVLARSGYDVQVEARAL
eukprot:Clim_evm38s142 gene=Clim_evmTU38s142